MANRIYCAIDLKSFYASVECFDRGLDPLTTNLVVADESRTDKTICLAVSPSLKAYGISGRARLFEVRAKLDEIKKKTGKEIPFIIAPPQMKRYLDVSSTIYSVYLDYVSPEDMHVYSIDEVFIDLTPYLNTYNMSAHDLTMQMVRSVLEQTGITATAGIGSNMYLAKIAMDIVAKHQEADQDGVRIAEIDEMSYRRLLWDHTPITDFWQVGRGTARRLAEYRMYTMGDIALESIQNEEHLYRIFGINAEILIDHAWGIEPTTIADIRSAKPKSNSLSSGQVLQEPYPYDKARIVISEMVDNMVLDMVKKKLVSPLFTVDIGYDRESCDNGTYRGDVEIDWYGRMVPKHAHGTANFGEATSLTSKIMAGVLETFDRIVDKSITIRRMTIAACNVVPEDSVVQQLDIFTDPDKVEAEKNLQKAMLSIKDRFGKNAILTGKDFLDGATMRERNAQIGGHKAANPNAENKYNVGKE